MRFLRLFLLSIISVTLTVLFTSCRSVPYTERSQMILISEEQEVELGKQAWSEILSKTKKSSNSDYNQALQRVGWNLARSVDKDYEWEFVVFENKDPNAFCLPGGKVGIFSGLFKYTSNDAELSSVVGHEIGHAIAPACGRADFSTDAYFNRDFCCRYFI